jgi:hypothetical protein
MVRALTVVRCICALQFVWDVLACVGAWTPYTYSNVHMSNSIKAFTIISALMYGVYIIVVDRDNWEADDRGTNFGVVIYTDAIYTLVWFAVMLKIAGDNEDASFHQPFALLLAAFVLKFVGTYRRRDASMCAALGKSLSLRSIVEDCCVLPPCACKSHIQFTCIISLGMCRLVRSRAAALRG